jgi:dihydroorotate dehydrogenase (NAD+) catalytic subunit
LRLLNASGCLDALAAPSIARGLDVFVTKTVTPLPREGNAPVRIAEVESGMLNSIGLANPGIDRFIDTVLPKLQLLELPLWVSVGGFGADDYARLCEIIDDHMSISAIELNVSCPNVDEAPDGIAQIVRSARGATRKPLYVKLSPGVSDITEIARAVEAAGADGLSLVNTIRGLALDPTTLRPRLARGTGGYSGPALKPVALAAVFACAAAIRLPIIGMGGISSGHDALEFLAAGAHDIALGTVLFTDPGAPTRVREELDAELAARGLASVDDVRAIAHERISTLAGRRVDTHPAAR